MGWGAGFALSETPQEQPRLHCPRCRAIYRVASPRCPRDGAALEPLTDDPLVGTRLAERYDIEALIGEGGMGRVYRARHAELGRTYAIKAMFGDLAANELMRARFAQEAHLASQLNHRNVVPVLDFGMPEDSVAYLVMDFVDGVPLSEALATHGPMPVPRAQSIAEGLARGLRYAHAQGLVHRDLKPDNVMLVQEDDEEVPKILDFGIAMRANTEKQDRLTSTGNIVGTPTYMAPEQAFGGPIDPSVDLYALGGVLFACLTGHPPFVGAPVSVLHRKLTDSALKVSQVALQPVPDHIASLTDRLLAREPQDRPATAQEVLDALAPIAIEPMATVDSVDGEASDEDPVWPPPRSSHRLTWLIAGGLAVLGAGGLGLVVWAPDGERSQIPVQAVLVAPSPAAAPARPSHVEPTPAPDPEPLEVAEPVLDEPNEARPPATTPRISRARPRSAAPKAARPIRPESAPAPKPEVQDQPGDEAPAADSYGIQVFTDAYTRVGQRLEAAADDASITGLRRRYLRIPFADGLRVQSVRRDALKELNDIERMLKGTASP